MKKSWSTWLAAAILSCLLNLGASPVAAYYPPLQATGSGSDGGVWFSVTLPQGGTIMGGGGYLPGITVSNFTNHLGVMAWILHNAETNYYSVEYCTFDPFLNTFVFGTQVGPYTEIDQLTVRDGVVAFVAKEIAKTYSKFLYSTYDPAKGAWQNQSFLPTSPEQTNNYEIITKDGVLVFYFIRDYAGIHNYTLKADIYDPAKGQWFSEFSIYHHESIFGPDPIPIDNVSIVSATISYDWLIPVGGPLHYIWGYDLSQHRWYEEPAKAGAYFVAQPTFGSSPLWVWFTDMSIAGTSWNWQFGDGSTSTDRSPYHSFTSAGNFQVSQQISGPNGSDTFSKTIIVSYAGKLGLPAMLQLLLLSD